MSIPSNSDIVVQKLDDGRLADPTKLGAKNELTALSCIKELLPRPPMPPDISVSGKFIPTVKCCPWRFVKHMPMKRISSISMVNHARKPKFRRILQLMQLVTQGAEHYVHPSGCPPLSRRGTDFAFDIG